MGSYYRGARFGPQAMRNEVGAGGIDMATMVDAMKELNIVDYGDIAVDNRTKKGTACGRMPIAGALRPAWA
jgi:agmatinase